MLRRVEQRLCIVITRLAALDAISEAYRNTAAPHGDLFLFDTVYTALWDGVIVGLGAVWDNTQGVASLPKLALGIRGFPGASELRDAIRRAGHVERAKLNAHRQNVVAHFNARLDLPGFDEQYKIRTADAWKDVLLARGYLDTIYRCLGSRVFHFDGVAEMAKEDAQRSLASWAVGNDVRVQQIRQSVGL